MRRPALTLLAVALVGLEVPPSGVSAATSVSFANPTVITVPVSGAATPYPSSITVSGLAGQVVKVTVTLVDLNHGHGPDLDILLVGPGGQTVLLLSDCCHPAPITRATPVFDDFGRSLTGGTSVSSGTTKPVNVDLHTDEFPAPAPPGPYGTRLSVFNGTDPNGAWRLFVHDDHPEHGGSIAGGWSLTLHTQTTANQPPATRPAYLELPASSPERDAGRSPASSCTREALACLQAELEPRRVYSPGRLGAWRTMSPTRTTARCRASRRWAGRAVSPGTRAPQDLECEASGM